MLRRIVWLLALVPVMCCAEKVALTFDDLPLNGVLQAGVNEVDIVKRVLPIFKARKGIAISETSRTNRTHCSAIEGTPPSSRQAAASSASDETTRWPRPS